jgi:hypothetical protein
MRSGRRIPFLFHPAVEGAECRDDSIEVGQQCLFHSDTERRQHDAAGHALLVHRHQPSVSVSVGRWNRFELTEQRVEIRAPRIASAEYSSSAPGLPTGSNVGFGMNLFTLPPTIRRCLPSMSAH